MNLNCITAMLTKSTATLDETASKELESQPETSRPPRLRGPFRFYRNTVIPTTLQRRTSTKLRRNSKTQTARPSAPTGTLRSQRHTSARYQQHCGETPRPDQGSTPVSLPRNPATPTTLQRRTLTKLRRNSRRRALTSKKLQIESQIDRTIFLALATLPYIPIASNPDASCAGRSLTRFASAQPAAATDVDEAAAQRENDDGYLEEVVDCALD